MNRERGFTLIELLIYIAIFAIVAGILSTIFYIVINSQKKQSISGEVTQQLNFVLGTIQRLVGDSSLVEAAYEGQDASSTCATFCTLRLRRTDPAKDPTIITSNANGIYLQEGSSAQVALTNSKVVINNLKFTKNEVPGAHAVVEINTSLTYNTANPRFVVTKAIESAIARVSAATFDADLLPNQDSTFDIGQITGNNLRWRNGHFSQNLTIAGNVGIGLTSPSYKLDVSGIVNATDYYKNGSSFAPYRILAYNEFTTNTTITATTEGAAAIIVTASAVTAASGDKIEVEFYTPEIWGDGTGTLTILLWEDSIGSSIGKLATFYYASSTARATPGHLERRLQPSAGSHTYSVRAYRSAPNWTIKAGSGGSGNLVPGFIKVTKVD